MCTSKSLEAQGKKYDLIKYTVCIHFVSPSIWESTKFSCLNKKMWITYIRKELLAFFFFFSCWVTRYIACHFDKMVSLLQSYSGEKTILDSLVSIKISSIIMSFTFPWEMCMSILLLSSPELFTFGLVTSQQGRYKTQFRKQARIFAAMALQSWKSH